MSAPDVRVYTWIGHREGVGSTIEVCATRYPDRLQRRAGRHAIGFQETGFDSHVKPAMARVGHILWRLMSGEGGYHDSGELVIER